MREGPRLVLGLLTFGVGCLLVARATADEGMWVYNNLPRKYLKEKHGFEPTQEWADHVMKSSVRFNSGGSGSFISSSGLVLTNHHVAADTVQKISTKERNYHHDGFYARSQNDEVKAPDLELNQLVSIEDVTKQVQGALKSGMSGEEAFKAKQAVIAQIEKESKTKTGLRSDVVTLYQGGQYHLYRYKKYTDVRLVFAPEFDIAFFGGDPDNFEYPRYDLDIAIFRVYEDNKPAKIEHFFKWSANGATENELVFVSGHPGRTSRLFTTTALEFLRDLRVPYTMNYLRRMEILYQQYGSDSEEAERRAKEDLFSVQNSRKAYTGMIQGLQTPSLLADKKTKEQTLREKVSADANLKELSDAWELIASAQRTNAGILRERALLEQGRGFHSSLFSIARTLVRMAAEDQKPNADRLREYRESGRESLLHELYSEAPIYNDFEQVKLADGFALLMEELGADHPIVKEALDGKGPQERASDLVQNTKLGDVAFRKQLGQGGAKATDACMDPMIKLARMVDEPARKVRKEFESKVQEVEEQAYAKIAKARFAIDGDSVYPDATFTLRLAYGPVMGYEENGKKIPAWTTMAGAFEHEQAHGSRAPWKLPKRWHERKSAANLNTPFNFVCTADIIGGNSGSPVFNKNGEFVGIIFDGNIQSLTADYIYTDQVSRAVSVHSAAIMESLRNIYDATPLADEIGK